MTENAVQLRPVLQKHLPSATMIEIDVLINLLISIQIADSKRHFPRQNDMEIAKAIKSLKDLDSTLTKAASAFDRLNLVGREALSRVIIGLDDVPEFEEDQKVKIFFDLGYRQRVLDNAASIKAMGYQVARAIEVLVPYKEKTDGRPPAEGARAIADICIRAFDEFVATPASPSWDPYKSAPSGKFFEMVRDVFKAVEIKGTAREFARQSAEAFAKEGKKTSRQK